MALFELNLTATPVNLSTLWGVADGTAVQGRGQNLGYFPAFRMVSATMPTDLDGAVFRYAPGEYFTFTVHAGATDGDTYFASSGPTVRVILEDNLPQ